MHVQYWSVGTPIMTPLPMSKAEISSHLLEDWIPSLPAGVASAFMGWPSVLTEIQRVGMVDYLALGVEVGRSERQWKGFLSWMLGVACARHVLAAEGYRWIAPASAFYPEARQPVAVPAWNLSFPQSALIVTAGSSHNARLRPDYLAIRDTDPGNVDWAVAEAKGTSRSLVNVCACPVNWQNQAHNIEVYLYGHSITIPRHIVVATRANPNGKKPASRQLQVRAWNSAEQQNQTILSQSAVADIAAAYLFGLFRNLGQRETARALAYSVLARVESSRYGVLSQLTRDTLARLRQNADFELERTVSQGVGGKIELSTELGAISIQVSPATIILASRLINSITEDETTKTLSEANTQLDEWQRSQGKTDISEALLRSGFRIRFPGDTFTQ